MKKNISLTTILLYLFITGTSAQTERAELLRNKILSGDTSTVIVVAHRGDWRYAPENSIAAIEHSIKVGVDVVELDLQLTKDSVLIVMHDRQLERTTTGMGSVREWTMDSLRTLKLKNGCGIKTKHHIPTLEEALLAAKGKVLVNLDKADRYFDLLYPVLVKTGTARQIIMKGKRPAQEVLSLWGQYLDQVIYMPVVDVYKDDAKQKMKGYMEILKPAAYELCYQSDDQIDYPLQIKEDLRGKSLIWYNTLWDTLCGGHDDDLALEDPDAAFGFLIDTLGARIIQTDRAELLLNYLKGRNLHP
ncbi:MAG: glycerophosphodiester phosphodiesterase family protein [Prevotella sp.]|nr:glycerophosphodiester phosphodiesterase family protein [Prevotella sp.]